MVAGSPSNSIGPAVTSSQRAPAGADDLDLKLAGPAVGRRWARFAGLALALQSQRHHGWERHGQQVAVDIAGERLGARVGVALARALRDEAGRGRGLGQLAKLLLAGA